MIKLKKYIIILTLFTSIFLSNINIINANSIYFTNNENQVHISVSGFIGYSDNVSDDTLEENSDKNNIGNNNNNIDKLPQTGQSIYLWGILFAIVLILIGNILRKKYNKQ